MVRARELGIEIGVLPPGPTNSVLDVPGVGLGHTTVVRDETAPPHGRGVARTGVSVLVLAEDAYRRPLAAGGAVLNGAGECTGFLSAGEWGAVESPVFLTSTLQVGRVYDAACELALELDPRSPTTWSSRWWPSATTRSSTTADACRSPLTTSGPRTPRH